jgi:polysaccharide biosynthesis transport protein
MSVIRAGGTLSGASSQTTGIGADGPPGSMSASRESVTLSDLLTALRRHAALVLAAAGVVGALAGWSVLREVPTYRATAVLRLTDARRSMTRGLDEGEAERPQTINPLLSQVQLLKSRALTGSVVDSEGLRLRPATRGFSAALLSQIHVEPAVIADTFFLGFSNEEVTVRNGNRETRVRYNVPYRTVGVSFAIKAKPDAERATLVLSPREKTIDRFLENLRVSSREETDVVDVSYADAVPDVAQRVVNRLVSTFQDVDVRQAQGQSRRRRIFLEEQLREVNSQLASSEAALASFRSREQVFSSRDKLRAEQTALLALDLRRGELDADRRMYESLLTKLRDSRGGRNDDELRALISAPDIGANPVVAQLYQQLAQYQIARDSLTTGQWRSAANNPDVTRLDQLIAASEQRLVGAVRGHITTVDARREALAALRTRSATAIEALPRAESAEERLSRQVESNRALADRLRGDYQKARMAEAVEAGQVEIVDRASLPYKPVARLRALRLLLGVLMGFVIGGIGALLIDSRKAHIRGRPDLEDEMRLPVLSVIPPIRADGKEVASFSRLTAMLHRGRRAGKLPALGESGANGHRQSSATGLMSPSGAEAFRLLRSSLKWSQRYAPGKTLAISSALPDEGKTTTSANLAVVCAFEGKRVLLIDCDLRRPRLHQVFRLPRQPGIAQVLRAGLSPAAAIRDTFVDRVSLLPAGGHADRFADLLGSDHMRSLLDELSEQFDMIVLDTPPVLTVADTAALAPLVDGVLLVVGAGTTNRHAVEQALQQLELVGAQVVGAVLNDSRGELQRYGGYYQYHYPYRDDYASSAGTA